MFLGKRVLKLSSTLTEEYPCRSVISIKLQSNFIEITLWHGCSPVNLSATSPVTAALVLDEFFF